MVFSLCLMYCFVLERCFIYQQQILVSIGWSYLLVSFSTSTFSDHDSLKKIISRCLHMLIQNYSFIKAQYKRLPVSDFIFPFIPARKYWRRSCYSRSSAKLLASSRWYGMVALNFITSYSFCTKLRLLFSSNPLWLSQIVHWFFGLNKTFKKNHQACTSQLMPFIHLFWYFLMFIGTNPWLV